MFFILKRKIYIYIYISNKAENKLRFISIRCPNCNLGTWTLMWDPAVLVGGHITQNLFEQLGLTRTLSQMVSWILIQPRH
jgi:hypothetical protein